MHCCCWSGAFWRLPSLGNYQSERKAFHPLAPIALGQSGWAYFLVGINLDNRRTCIARSRESVVSFACDCCPNGHRGVLRIHPLHLSPTIFSNCSVFVAVWQPPIGAVASAPVAVTKALSHMSLCFVEYSKGFTPLPLKKPLLFAVR